MAIVTIREQIELTDFPYIGWVTREIEIIDIAKERERDEKDVNLLRYLDEVKYAEDMHR